MTNFMELIYWPKILHQLHQLAKQLIAPRKNLNSGMTIGESNQSSTTNVLLQAVSITGNWFHLFILQGFQNSSSYYFTPVQSFIQNHNVKQPLSEVNDRRFVLVIANLSRPNRRQKLKHFCNLVQGQNVTSYISTAHFLLLPILSYMHMFDHDDSRLSHFLPEPLKHKTDLNNQTLH